MTVSTVKEYNRLQTAKWEKDWHNHFKERQSTWNAPQLAFYVFEKNYGYVARDKNCAMWAKSKKEVIDLMDNRKIY